MKRLSTTPFGQRPVSLCLREAQAKAEQRPALPHVNKYEILRLLGMARRDFGISDRDLGLLAALASFSKGQELRADMNLIVFPSNKTLAERAHGMPESTLRRHLAALVKAGLILRHDSPNGKRYAARGAEGAVARVFGFDLTPLLARAQEIALAAERVRIEEAERHALREQAVLALRDAGKMIVFGVSQEIAANWDELSDQVKLAKRRLRRKLDADGTRGVLEVAQGLLERVAELIDEDEKSCETVDVSGNDGQNERHHYNKTKELNDSELLRNRDERQGCDLQLREVLEACLEIRAYVDGKIRHWHQLVAAAAFVRAMMGIGADVWDQAVRDMGAEAAAVTVAAMLERFESLENPGAYLRILARKAADGGFSPRPMVMALLKSREKAVA